MLIALYILLSLVIVHNVDLLLYTGFNKAVALREELV